MSVYGPADRQRWIAEDATQKRAHRDDFARDRARLLHSAALRRLSAKTQVLRPDSDDFVRNRLTHSLEVAQIGRELGASLGCSADVVDTACLAHDLGHPPFGHNGETALALLTSDIGGFEGNAQTFRLLTRLEAKRVADNGRSAGLNLTRATLDAATKYPWRFGQGPSETPKFGVYEDDADVFDWVRSESPRTRDGNPAARSCLEAQVMDWADDVAYSVHDVEDAVTGGFLDLRVLRSREDMAAVFDVARRWYLPATPLSELEEAVDNLLRSNHIHEGYDGTRGDLAALKNMTSSLIGRFVLAADRATREQYGPKPLVRYDADLVVPQSFRAECAVLKALAAHFVMLAPSRIQLMAAERAMVNELYTAFLAAPERRLDAELRLDFDEAADDEGRRRVIIDQVASLSDVRARMLYRRWCA